MRALRFPKLRRSRTTSETDQASRHVDEPSNGKGESAIDILSNDLLIEIISIILDPNAFKTTRLYWIQARDLSLVCRAWRRTILETRTFQAVIPFDAPEEVTIRLLQRSGKAPLTVGLNRDLSPPRSLAAVERLLEELYRWQSASLFMTSSAIQAAVDRSGLLPESLDLRIRSHVGENGMPQGHNRLTPTAPLLRHLTIFGRRIPRSLMQTLRSLDVTLQNSTHDYVIDLCDALVSCPQLESLKFSARHGSQSFSIPQNTTQISMPCLREIDLEVPSRVTKYLHSCMLLPSLRILHTRILVPPPDPDHIPSGPLRGFHTRLAELVSTYDRAFVFGFHQLYNNLIACDLLFPGDFGKAESRIWLEARRASDIFSWIASVLTSTAPPRVILDTFDPISMATFVGDDEVPLLISRIANVHSVRIDPFVDNRVNLSILRTLRERGPQSLLPQIRQVALCIQNSTALRRVVECMASEAAFTPETEVDPALTLVMWIWCEREDNFDEMAERVRDWLGAGELAFRYSEDDWDVCRLDDWMMSAQGLDLWTAYRDPLVKR